MKTFILIINTLTALTIFFSVNAFSQQIEWAAQVAPYSNWNAGNHIHSDSAGNVYVTGLYNGDTAAGGFITKYNSVGILVWTQNILGALIYGGETDSFGNTYISGRFGGTANFGSFTLNGNGWDFFLAKYNSYGTCLWVQQAGQALGKALKADGNGNIYVTGDFGGSCTFGNTTITQTNSGIHDNFLAKYNASGQCLWVQQIIGSSYGNGGDINIDANENIYITDKYILPITFGNGSDTTTLTTHGGSIYLAKYTSTGTFEWAKQISDSGHCESRGIVIDNFGNIYISGWFSYIVHFENTILTCSGGENGFLAKYNSSGVLDWIKQPLDQPVNHISRGFGISLNTSNEIFLTGNFVSSGIYSNVIKYDSLGNEKWRSGYSTTNGRVISYGISIDTRNNIYIAGEFMGDVQFGSYNINRPFNGPDRDAFLVKILDNDDQSTGIIQIQNNITFIVYPNPTSGIFQINYSAPVKGSLQLNVTDTKGKTVYTETVSQFNGEFKKQIDLGKKATGVYFVEMSLGKDRKTKKIIIE